ncbi:MAG: hypothetical protein J5827_00965 [Oscillospiraceae bacterium]|nr:hypothetical protein [Oscillospiraceae bacterium]
MDNNCCCCGAAGKAGQKKNCVVCGEPIVYFPEERQLECLICHKIKPANAACEKGHFVCDDCHSGGGAEILGLLQQSREKDPIALLCQVLRLDGVHLHGPEHHGIVPCVLITAFHNCGGQLDYEKSLTEAWKRGQKIPGGSCGYLGVCGAAAGAGIFASIVSGATPLNKEKWAIPQRLSSECLNAIAATGGPRCCKRTSRIAIECAAAFSEKEFGVVMPVSRPSCDYWAWNSECIRQDCPFFPRKKNDDKNDA